MTFIELFTLKGVLSEAQRRRLGETLVTELMHADGAPADLIERGRGLTWSVVHELDTWAVGGQCITSAQAPRYFVRVSVPGGHLNDTMRAELIKRITRALAKFDTDPRRLYRAPDVWVHIVELPDGNIGSFGQIVRLADIVKLVVDPDYKVAQDGIATDAPATVTDPICGMAVPLTGDAIILEHNGTTYAFCSIECRNLFAAQQAATTSVKEEQ